MRFADHAAFWLSALSLLAIFAMVYGAYQRQQAQRRLGEWGVVKPLLAEVSRHRRQLRASLLVIAILGLTLAAIRPQWGASTDLARHRGLDVVFALDVSQSMLARDVRPDRLARAKLEIAALTEQLTGNRIGIIAFAGTAFVQCPLTTDSSAVKMFLNSLDPDTVPQGGTALAKALLVAERLFSSSASKAAQSGRHHGQVLVLITDGEDHEGEVAQVAARLKEAGIVVFAVGIGSEEGEPIPIIGENDSVVGYLKDKKNQPVLSRLSSQTLNTLAEKAGGTALLGPQVDQNLLLVAQEIDKLEKSEFESRLVVHYQERFQWPLAVGLVSLLLFFAIRERSRKET